MFLKKSLFFAALWLIKCKTKFDEKRNKPIDVNFFRKVIYYCNYSINLFQSPRKEVKIEQDQLGDIFCFRFEPPHKTEKTILYLHGGGYLLGLKDYCDYLYFYICAELAAQCEAQVFAIEYRLAPEYSQNAILNDAYQAYLGLIEKGIEANNIFIMGDSAGGGLTLALLMKIKQQQQPLPCGAVTLSPWTNLAGDGASMLTRAFCDPILTPFMLKQAASLVLGNDSPQHSALSPLHNDFEGLPPLMIVAGGREILLNDSIDVANKALKAGVKVILDINEKMFHIYPVFGGIFNEGKEAITRIVSFIKNP